MLGTACVTSARDPNNASHLGRAASISSAVSAINRSFCTPLAVAFPPNAAFAARTS